MTTTKNSIIKCSSLLCFTFYVFSVVPPQLRREGLENSSSKLYRL